MAFNGTEGASISLTTGGQMTARFRGNFPNESQACFFGRDILLQLLNQNGAKGIRMYFAQDSNDVLQLVICAADSDENDMCALVADYSVICPSRCGKNNALNN